MKLLTLDIEALKRKANMPLSHQLGPVARARRKLAVLERDGYKCVQCGSTENLTIDHVKKNNQHRRRNATAYSTRLCQTLCAPCHENKNRIMQQKPADTLK